MSVFRVSLCLDHQVFDLTQLELPSFQRCSLEPRQGGDHGRQEHDTGKLTACGASDRDGIRRGDCDATGALRVSFRVTKRLPALVRWGVEACTS